VLTLSALKASDIPDPEYASGETRVYSKRRDGLCEWPVSKGRSRIDGRIYFCLRLADGFRTYPTLSALKGAIRA
jgi:hypothetical protein